MDEFDKNPFERADEGAPSEDSERSASGAVYVQAKVVTPPLQKASEGGCRGIVPPPVMPEVEAIRTHPLFKENYARVVAAEEDRVFCRHQMRHLLDTARIAYIRVLERGLPFRKEVVYAAALLHDIGKAQQYEQGEPHEVAGARIAQRILMDVEGFDPREKTMIVAAVAQHRRWSDDSTPLGKLLYEADKSSRACFVCPEWDACAWPEGRKNPGVSI